MEIHATPKAFQLGQYGGFVDTTDRFGVSLGSKRIKTPLNIEGTKTRTVIKPIAKLQ